VVRHGACPTDPAHLAAGLGRVEAARRGETLLVVAPGGSEPLLDHVHTARRAGVTVLALSTTADDALTAMAHETLSVPEGAELDLDTVQHLVSAATGENGPSPRARRRFRDRLSRLAETVTAPPPTPW
jgi:hypothetical protein